MRTKLLPLIRPLPLRTPYAPPHPSVQPDARPFPPARRGGNSRAIATAAASCVKPAPEKMRAAARSPGYADRRKMSTKISCILGGGGVPYSRGMWDALRSAAGRGRERPVVRSAPALTEDA